MYHILNGDCLAVTLQGSTFENNLIVFRECLIVGDLRGDSISEFWNNRASFIESEYNIPKTEYYNKTVAGFDKIISLPANTEIYLWFGNDLFCQANMWFLISLIAAHTKLKLYRIFPQKVDQFGTCKGFETSSTRMLEHAFKNKILFSQSEIELGINLWNAFRNNELITLKELSKIASDCFQNLKEVCQAHIDRFQNNGHPGRPEMVIENIIETVSDDFQVVFSEFSKREPVYGFGDLQLMPLYQKVMHQL